MLFCYLLSDKVQGLKIALNFNY